MSPRPQATAQATGWRRASRTSLYVEGTDQNAEGDLKLEFKRPDDTLIWEDIVHYTAIAADCKNQPTTTYDPLYGDSQRGFFESRFPNLRRCEWSATAGATDVYNCIAWSIGVTNQWIWYQIDAAGDGDGVVEEREFDNFYDDNGYVVTGDVGEAVIMLYELGAEPKHAARRRTCQCGDAEWVMFESKCGAFERIEHEWDKVLPIYGQPDRYYKAK